MKKRDGAKKSLFNIFNILIVLIIVAGIGAALYFFVLKDDQGGAAELSDVEYTVEIKNVRDELTDKISSGDRLLDSVGQIDIGVVDEIEYAQSRICNLDNETGELVISEYPDHSDIIVTVSAKAVLTDMGYDINGCVINVGTPVYARFPGFVGTGYCISMKVVNK